MDLDDYIGGDIVPELIQANQAAFAGRLNWSFIEADITSSALPKVDAILCRDCLVHLPFADIAWAVAQFKKSRSTYLITTTFTDRKEQSDIQTGLWRRVNLILPPTNFPEPVRVISEKCTQDGMSSADKALGVWRIAEL